MLTRIQEARARNLVKRAKRRSASAERPGIDFAEMTWRYNKADHMFMRAYGALRLKGLR